MRWRALATAIPVLVLLALAAGCGDQTPTVHGLVTLDDKPVAEGRITYIAADGKTPPMDVKITDGKYSARVPQGSFRVQISAPKPTGEKRAMLPDSPPVDVIAESIPERYNVQTVLTAEIKAGDNKYDWPLKNP